jgi:tRNA-binding protein
MPEMIPAPVKSPISLADVERIDIRVGTIQAVEDVPSSQKLVRLRVDFGDHRRTILAGLKKERPRPLDVEGGDVLRRAGRRDLHVMLTLAFMFR